MICAGPVRIVDGLEITRVGSSYEVHAPFDVRDGHVDGERRRCAEFRQAISAR
jgi:hypothetical protein